MRTTSVLSFLFWAALSPFFSQPLAGPVPPPENYTLMVNTVGKGVIYQDREPASHAPGSLAILTAVPAPESGFTHWSGDVSGTENPITVVMNSDKTVTAHFTSYKLTVVLDGKGTVLRDLELDGYPPNTQVILNAVPAVEYGFTRWSGDACGEGNVTTVVMNSDKTVTAHLTSYRLNIGNHGRGQVLRDLEQSGYAPGTCVIMNAVAEREWGFLNWSGDAAGRGRVVTVLMDSDKAITANFASYQLALTTNGSGAIYLDREQGGFAPDTPVILSAVPAAGCAFLSWSGDVNTTANPITVQMNESKQLTASFAPRPHLQIERSATSSGASLCVITLFGRAGERYAIDFSTDSVNWTRLGTVTNLLGYASLTAQPADPDPRRFYRASVILE